MKSKLIIVGIVFGGVSAEHEVSIKSAKTVINALRDDENYTFASTWEFKGIDKPPILH